MAYKPTKKSPSLLIHMVRDVSPVFCSLACELAPSSLSALLFACKIMIRGETMRRYLNPIREISEHRDWIEEKISTGRRVMLVGKDVNRLATKILDPKKYWSPGFDRSLMLIWLAVVHPVAYKEPNWSLSETEYDDEISDFFVGKDGVEREFTGTAEDVYESEDLFATLFELPTSGTDSFETTTLPRNWYAPRLTNANRIELVFCGMKVLMDPRTHACLHVDPLGDPYIDPNEYQVHHTRFLPNIVEHKVTPEGRSVYSFPYMCLHTLEPMMGVSITDPTLPCSTNAHPMQNTDAKPCAHSHAIVDRRKRSTVLSIGLRNGWSNRYNDIVTLRIVDPDLNMPWA